jgi:protein tyrosine/serine phosphatase
MQAGNRSYPERLAAAVAETFRAVVAAGEKAGSDQAGSAQAGSASSGRGVLFHCSAGKDRTGFVAAMLLLSAGASRETVIEDYLATNLIWRRNSVFINQLPEAVREPVFAARADYIESALEEVDSRYGSVEAYLAGRCAIASDLLTRYAEAIAE